MAAKNIAVVNQKGGTSKITVSMNLTSVQLLNKLPEKEIIELIKNLPKVKTGRSPIE
jgi:MinD superfamily P-loop ATPase